MKKTAKVLAMMLALVLCVAAFAGCGGSAAPAEAPKEAAEAATEAVSEAAAAATEAVSEAAAAATEAVSEAAAAAEEAAPAAAADIDPSVLGTFEFSFTCHDPDTSAKVQYMQSLCDEVYEKTNGGVKMTMYNGGTLVASTDVAQAVEDGTADIGWLFTTFFPGEFPLSDIVTMPRVFDTNVQANEVLLDLLANNADIQAEMSRYHILSASCNPMNTYYYNKEITDPADFTGLQFRCPAGAATEVTKLLGASPVLMGPGDIYESIEKNVLDGYTFEPSGVKSFNLQEVTSYYMDVPIYCGIFYVVMNNDSWNSLPAEYQDIITEVWTKGSIGQTEVFNQDVEVAYGLFDEAGLQVQDVPDAVVEAIDAAAKTYVDTYIAEHDCQALFDEAMSYKANHPAN